jgi:NADH-quinone oxidoreductase subunit A
MQFPAGYAYVAVFALASLVFAGVALGTAWLLRPSDPYPEKLETYECGFEPRGQAWHSQNFHYYIFCLIFVVFDVEMVFLYPWADVFKGSVRGAYQPFGLTGPLVFVEMLIFVVVLLVGFAYAWRKGALRWV